jgi:pilus assembly protein CpaF
MSDGTRRITHITELTGAYSEVISMNDLFLFEKRGLGLNGKVNGRFYSTGVMPRFGEKLLAAGLSLPVGLLDHVQEV